MTRSNPCASVLFAAVLAAAGCGLQTGGLVDEDADAAADDGGETGGEVGADGDADGADAAEVGADADADADGDDDAEVGADADGDADAAADGDADADVVVGCLGPADCDDGVTCTTDVCDPVTHICHNDFTPGACDDHVDCTADRCDPLVGGCVHTPDDGYCADAEPCNGVESCDPASGCRPGSPVSCDDGVACTVDTCTSGTGACVHTPDDARCDDGAFCNGAEVCRAGAGCVAGTAPTCDDGLACSVDSCDPTAAGGVGACVHLGPDVDGDTYRDAACGGTDCDDARPAIHPGAVELCDGVDQDCSGYPDDAPGTCSGCTPGVHGGHVYQFCTATVIWTTARDNCSGLSGYYLVTVNDAAENGFLAATAAAVRAGAWWIGFNDRGTEGSWVWASGSSSYRNWYAGEPNNSGSWPGEDCADLNQMAVLGQWNDARCDDRYTYICEHN